MIRLEGYLTTVVTICVCRHFLGDDYFKKL